MGNDTLECEISSDGRVRRFHIGVGVVYQIQARVLPFLSGSIYLVALFEETPSVANVASSQADWILIDSGSGSDESNSDVESAFRTIREEFEPSFKPEKIKRIVLTHAHVDHFGGAYELWRQTGAEVWVHAFESRLVSAYDECACVENCRYVSFLREAGVDDEEIPKILDGFGFRPGRAKSVEVARKLFGGETFGALRFLYFPGHSPGHLAIQCGNATFSGDLLLSKTLTQIWPTRMTPQTGVVNYVRSLKNLERFALQFERRAGERLMLLPAHEELIENVPARVEQALRSMERRDDRLLTLLQESETPLSLAEITKRMYWSGRPNREFFALSDVGSRTEYLLQLGLLRVVEYERLTATNPVLLYKVSLADAEATKNTIQQIVGMDAPCD